MEESADYMGLALELARKALGRTSPNPAVGAVLVNNGAIVGRGYTQPPGSSHAEIVALGQAGAMARGARMYVTLEPCCHHGRTPPCTEAIIAAGVLEVHIALRDPNPLVDGRGRAALEQAGIQVRMGERLEEAATLNEPFIKHITTGLPLVIAKFASSLDGKIATRSGDSKWISGEAARRRVHQVRDAVDAVMVGVNTVLADDPQLTCRLDTEAPEHGERQPVRVIVDSQGRTPPDARVLQCPGLTLLAATEDIEAGRAGALERAGAEVLCLPKRNGMVDLTALLRELGKRDITSILVEGGGTLLGSLLEEGLVDKVMAFVAPVLIGGRDAPSPMEGAGIASMEHAVRLRYSRVENIGEDILITGYAGYCAIEAVNRQGQTSEASHHGDRGEG